MGRLVGFEPTHIGTTIRGLNRLTTDAIRIFILTQKISLSSIKKPILNIGFLIKIEFLAYSLKHISDTAGC